MADIAGEPAALRFQSFAVEGLEDRMLQLQVLLFAPPDGREKTKDLFHIDGSCLDGDKERTRRCSSRPRRASASCDRVHRRGAALPGRRRAVPGLGPLPLDPADEAALRLMRGTAERSLRARGLLGAREVTALLEPLDRPGLVRHRRARHRARLGPAAGPRHRARAGRDRPTTRWPRSPTSGAGSRTSSTCTRRRLTRRARRRPTRSGWPPFWRRRAGRRGHARLATATSAPCSGSIPAALGRCGCSAAATLSRCPERAARRSWRD